MTGLNASAMTGLHASWMTAAGALALLLAACGGPPQDNPMIEKARTEFQRTAADPAVAQHAPVALEEARAALEEALAIWRERARPEVVDHHAYLAQQQARIARQRARLRAAEAAFAALEEQRVLLALEARTAEAEAAEARARAERLQAERARREAEAAARRARALAERVAELEAQLTHRGLVLTLDDPLFEAGRAELREAAHRKLAPLVRFLREHPERRVLVEGHTDATGSRELNMRLSRARAEAVRAALIARGIAPNRIETVGLGPDFPIASNATAAGRQQNRRVEIIISDAHGRIPPRQP